MDTVIPAPSRWAVQIAARLTKDQHRTKPVDRIWMHARWHGGRRGSRVLIKRYRWFRKRLGNIGLHGDR